MTAPARGREPEPRQHAEQLAAKLPPLLVAAERVAATVAQGVHGRRRVGQGETFWQFRRYGSGDPAHAIDWRQSARSRHLFVRETEWEAAQTVWLWRDTSASMRYRSHERLATKAERADLLLLATAAMLVRGAERFALLGAGFPPASGRAAFHRLAATVLRNVERGEGHPPFEPLPRYAQVLLIGDFLAPLEHTREAVMRFAARGVRGQLLQILDPAETNLPFKGRIRFTGLENEPPVMLGRVEALRARYRQRVADHRAALADLARHAGWGFIAHTTDRPPQAALLSLYTALAPRTGR